MLTNLTLLDSSNYIRIYESRHQLNKENSPINVPENIGYYKKIEHLINNKTVSLFITFETEEIINWHKNDRVFPLFLNNGISRKMSLKTRCSETVHPTIFYKCACELNKSRCIIIDPSFLSINVGRSLSNYIDNSSKVFSIGKRIVLEKYDNEIMFIDTSMQCFVDMLFSPFENLN